MLLMMPFVTSGQNSMPARMLPQNAPSSRPISRTPTIYAPKTPNTENSAASNRAEKPKRPTERCVARATRRSRNATSAGIDEFLGDRLRGVMERDRTIRRAVDELPYERVLRRAHFGRRAFRDDPSF